MEHESVFKHIYEGHVWGSNVSPNFKGNSGGGSSVDFNKDYITFLRRFIQQQNIKSVVDLGCGDWRCGKAIYEDLSCSYVGYDIYDTMIKSHNETYKDPRWKFEVMNCFADLEHMEKADLLIVKDVLQHWTDKEVSDFMEYQTTAKQYKYILITNCSFRMPHVLLNAGGWRTLPKDHPLLAKYNLLEVFTYSTKSVLLMMP